MEELEDKIYEVLSNNLSLRYSKYKINRDFFTILNKNIKFYAIFYEYSTDYYSFDRYKEIQIDNEFKNKITILNDIGFLNYNFKDKEGREFSSLSTGERNSFISFLLLYDQIIEVTKYEKEVNDYIILLDEPDTTGHPDWQKKYINELLKIFSKIPKNFHFFITSHSPFLISDIPKENVIFLKNGKPVDGVSMKQTFGANIHTLLSDGFFMNDGLMGEFAKGKIQSIIKYHEEITKKEILEADKIEYKTKKQKEFWHIQSIIGDDYLKQVIKNHLIEIEKIVLGNDNAKEAEIQRLQAQIDALKGNKC